MLMANGDAIFLFVQNILTICLGSFVLWDNIVATLIRSSLFCVRFYAVIGARPNVNGRKLARSNCRLSIKPIFARYNFLARRFIVVCMFSLRLQRKRKL